MTTWILEKDVFAYSCFDAMVAHFEAKAIPYDVVRIIPFIHEIEGKVPAVADVNDVVVYGSVGSQKLAAKHAWKPGVFGTVDTFSEAVAERELGSLYLNYGQFRMPIKKLGQTAHHWAKLMVPLHQPPLEEFFIKPDTDTKEFAGTVIKIDEFGSWYTGLQESGYLDDNDFNVVISRPKKLGCEWRAVVVDGEISSCSIYRQYQRVMPELNIIPEVEAAIKEAISLYRPADVFVIDICQVWRDDAWQYKVIEFNTFNSAGLYACDVTKIIDDINAFLARKISAA
jgi:hypothetical protein